MNVAIIGYGKMGRSIEKILLERGHNVALIVDQDNRGDINAEKMQGVDVAIEFTTPESAYENLVGVIKAGVPVVSGTTGWLSKMGEIETLCKENGGALFYASNYSLGVNLMFRISKQLAKMIGRVEGYTAQIDETHHIHKLDAPSGTAITLAEGVMEGMPLYDKWVNDAPSPSENELNIFSHREGEVVGIHSVKYESHEDTLEIRHSIKERSALALGAVIAAEFLAGKQGVYSMDDLLK